MKNRVIALLIYGCFVTIGIGLIAFRLLISSLACSVRERGTTDFFSVLGDLRSPRYRATRDLLVNDRIVDLDLGEPTCLDDRLRSYLAAKKSLTGKYARRRIAKGRVITKEDLSLEPRLPLHFTGTIVRVPLTPGFALERVLRPETQVCLKVGSARAPATLIAWVRTPGPGATISTEAILGIESVALGHIAENATASASTISPFTHKERPCD